MLTFEEIKKAVRDIEHVEISNDDGSKGVRYTNDGYVVEILESLIAVREEDASDMDWEFRHDPTIEDMTKTMDDPGWLY